MGNMSVQTHAEKQASIFARYTLGQDELEARKRQLTELSKIKRMKHIDSQTTYTVASYAARRRSPEASQQGT